MVEHWAQIDGAIDGYMVSDRGRVKGIRKPILGQFDNGIGYLQTKIKFKDGTARFMKVHRLVAMAFVPNPYGYSDVNHKDGNKANNAADNLEWCSHSDNVRHAYMTGLHGYKEKPNGKERLTPDQVRAIRESTKTSTELAKEYGVSQPMISNIRTRKIYAWVK